MVLWQDFQELKLQAASGASIDALGFSGEGHWLAAAGQAGEVMIWRLTADSSELVKTLTWGSAWIDRLQWHPHQPWLACNCGRAVHILGCGAGQSPDHPRIARPCARFGLGSRMALTWRFRLSNEFTFGQRLAGFLLDTRGN